MRELVLELVPSGSDDRIDCTGCLFFRHTVDHCPRVEIEPVHPHGQSDWLACDLDIKGHVWVVKKQ